MVGSEASQIVFCDCTGRHDVVDRPLKAVKGAEKRNKARKYLLTAIGLKTECRWPVTFISKATPHLCPAPIDAENGWLQGCSYQRGDRFVTHGFRD